MPEVSIIIPTYNRADYLKETLESVLLQTFMNWECIIVDDGSTDNSQFIINQLISQDNRFHYYSRLDTDKPKGVSSCRNIGIDKANGNFIVFLDSDDLLLNHCLEHRLKYVNDSQKVDFFIFKMQVLKNDKLDRIIGKIPKNNKRESYIEMIFGGIQPFAVTSILWSREALVNLHGFDECLQRLEDPDLHLRAFYADMIFIHLYESKPDCLYRMDYNYQGKFENKELLNKICESYLYFTHKHTSLLDENKIIDENKKKAFIGAWSLYFFKDYFLRLNSSSMYSKFFKLIRNESIFPRKQLFEGKIIACYNFMGFNNIKGLGYNRLQKRFFNQTN